MGSLSSRPSVTTTPQIVYVPQTTTTTSATTASTVSSDTDTADTESALASQTRQQNLLSISRGRAGTILTGFRGLLDLSDTQTSRKSLLGE